MPASNALFHNWVRQSTERALNGSDTTCLYNALLVSNLSVKQSWNNLKTSAEYNNLGGSDRSLHEKFSYKQIQSAILATVEAKIVFVDF